LGFFTAFGFVFGFCLFYSFHVQYKNLSLNHFLNRFCFKVCLLRCCLQLQLFFFSLSPSFSLSLSLNHSISFQFGLYLAGSQQSQSVAQSPQSQLCNITCVPLFTKSDKVETQPELCTRLTHTRLSYTLSHSLLKDCSLSPSLSHSCLVLPLLSVALCICSYSVPQRLKPEIVLGLAILLTHNSN